MMKFSRRLLAIAVCGVVALAAPASAQTFKLKYGWATTDNPTDPHAVAAHEFKRLVEESTAGQVVIELYPNRQLGDEKPLLEGMRLGTVDVATITNGSTAQIEQAFQVIDLPFLFPTTQKAHEVLDGDFGVSLGRKLESKGIVTLGYIELGFRHMINNVRPVNAPADVVGVKYRVIGNPLFISMFEALGASPIPMPWGEMFTAIQQGAIDGLDSPITIVDQNKIYDLAKFYSLTSHSYTAAELLIAKRSLERMPADVQEKVRAAAAAAVRHQRKVNAETSAASLEAIKKAGMQVNEVADLAPFREAVTSVYERASGTIGADTIEQVEAAIGAAN